MSPISLVAGVRSAAITRTASRHTRQAAISFGFISDFPTAFNLSKVSACRLPSHAHNNLVRRHGLFQLLQRPRDGNIGVRWVLGLGVKARRAPGLKDFSELAH